MLVTAVLTAEAGLLLCAVEEEEANDRLVRGCVGVRGRESIGGGGGSSAKSSTGVGSRARRALSVVVKGDRRFFLVGGRGTPIGREGRGLLLFLARWRDRVGRDAAMPEADKVGCPVASFFTAGDERRRVRVVVSRGLGSRMTTSESSLLTGSLIVFPASRRLVCLCPCCRSRGMCVEGIGRSTLVVGASQPGMERRGDWLYSTTAIRSLMACQAVLRGQTRCEALRVRRQHEEKQSRCKLTSRSLPRTAHTEQSRTARDSSVLRSRRS